MKFATILAAFCVFLNSTYAQSTSVTYDPDADGDNLIGVNDILALLSLYGDADVDDDGIWDSADDCLADSCSPKAYLVTEPQYLADAIGTYMFYSGASNFIGYSTGSGAIQNATDAELYFNFMGEVAGQDTSLWVDNNGNGESEASEFFPFVIPSILNIEIPEVSGGIDDYGNPELQYLFNTIEVPQGSIEGNFWWVLVINEEFLTDEEGLYLTSLIGLGASPSFCQDYNLDSTHSSYSFYLDNSQFGTGYFRCFGFGQALTGNVEGQSLFLKGLGYTLE
jgi:hypothetical protein